MGTGCTDRISPFGSLTASFPLCGRCYLCYHSQREVPVCCTPQRWWHYIWYELFTVQIPSNLHFQTSWNLALQGLWVL